MNDIKKERELVWVQILYLYLIPIMLLFYKVLPSYSRIPLLFIVALFIYGITRYEKWTTRDFGIQKNWKKYFWPYFLFTVVGFLFLLVIEEIDIAKPMLSWWTNTRFLLLFIPISFLQELIFRGVLMNMLRKVFTSKWFIILLNASVFALMHIIYLHAYFTLPLTFVAGIGFAWIYYKYPNLVLISIAHTILNFTGMILGFFVIR